MDSILGNVTTGASASGLRMLVAAQEKMGKTTICSQAPSPVLVPLEVGFAGVNVPKVPMLQSYAQVMQLLDEITAAAQKGQFPYRTIIWDSATALERMIHEHVLGLDPAYAANKAKVTMESAHGGYGKAYTMANTFFDNFLKKLDVLAVYAGINMLLTCHVFSSKVMDPTAGEYDSWDLLLHSPKNQKTYGKRELITQWADVIGFLYEPMFVTSIEGKSTMVKGMSKNQGRVMAVSRTPAYTAGNRFGMLGEISICAPSAGNGWNCFAQMLYEVTARNGAPIDVYTR